MAVWRDIPAYIPVLGIMNGEMWHLEATFAIPSVVSAGGV